MTVKIVAMAAGLALAACTQPGAASSSAAASAPAGAPPPTVTTTNVTPTAPMAPTTPGMPAPANPYGAPQGYPRQQAPVPPAPGGGAPPIQNSLADATLRGDVLRTVLGGASQLAPGCDTQQAMQTLDVGTATVTQRPVQGGPWQEVWPISMCGQTRSVQIDFTPTPQQGGTDFRIRLRPTSADAGK